MEESELPCTSASVEVDDVVEMRGTKRKISLSSCWACASEEAKYRCPACEKQSCSLPCVKRHKLETGCTGVRDRTAFVPISKFDEMNMLSDYRFLEDAGRLADSVTRDLLRLPQHKNQRAKILKQGARRFNLDLKLLPSGFTKRRENSTFFNKSDYLGCVGAAEDYMEMGPKGSVLLRGNAAWFLNAPLEIFGPFELDLGNSLTVNYVTEMVYEGEDSREQQFFWHLKLLFPGSSTEYTERRVPDSRTLKQILTPYIHPSESDPVRRQKLKVYVQAAFDNVTVLMKVENRRSDSVRYHELDLQATLQNNLRNKTVIEYPVLHVVLRSHCESFHLLDKAAAARGPEVTPVVLKGAQVSETEVAKIEMVPASADDELEEGEIRDGDDKD